MERTRLETLKLFVVSDVGRRSSLLSSTRSTRWWQSSLPRSDAPSPAGCPWSAKRFYKGRSQEKTHLLRLEFFLLRSPPDRAKSVLAARAMCQVVGQGSPHVLIC